MNIRSGEIGSEWLEMILRIRNRNMKEEHQQQYLQQFQIHPIKHQVQTPRSQSQYASESGAHADLSQG